jgi:hypothetical protein
MPDGFRSTRIVGEPSGDGNCAESILRNFVLSSGKNASLIGRLRSLPLCSGMCIESCLVTFVWLYGETPSDCCFTILLASKVSLFVASKPLSRLIIVLFRLNSLSESMVGGPELKIFSFSATSVNCRLGS